MKFFTLATLASLFLTISYSTSAAPVIAKNGMVVSEHRLASQVGIRILKQGGNAIDAAVAVGYALAVVNACCGNIGGGGFMTIHLADGRNLVLNFREKAPLQANQHTFIDAQGHVATEASLTGYRAVAVPGTVLGLETARQQYGTMTRAQLLQPAIQLAKEGYIVTADDAALFRDYADDFRKQPNVAAIFLKNDKPYQAGERLIQTDLAATLSAIAQQGPDAFYRGRIAQTIVTASHAQHGLLTLADFAAYHVTENAPIQCTYKGYHILSAPPPSAGGVILCEMLGILAPLSTSTFLSAAHVKDLIETMRYGYIDRNTLLDDPDFTPNPLQQLLSPRYHDTLRQRVELTDTTHYSVIDRQGNAVAVTYTINGLFGARIIAGNTGFFLNNEMNDFSLRADIPNKFGLVQGNKNSIAGGKRPLSSMTPTIVMKEGRVVMVLGSPGGSRIISTVLLTLLNVIDRGMDIQSAVNAPRFHFQAIPNVIDMEPFALPVFTRWQLEQQGYPFVTYHQWGAVEAIAVDPAGRFHGANDIRRPDGAAIGY